MTTTLDTTIDHRPHRVEMLLDTGQAERLAWTLLLPPWHGTGTRELAATLLRLDSIGLNPEILLDADWWNPHDHARARTGRTGPHEPPLSHGRQPRTRAADPGDYRTES